MSKAALERAELEEELADLGPVQYSTRRINLLLKKNINSILELLKDNHDFAIEIINKLLVVGAGVYLDEIYRLIDDKYPSEDESHIRGSLTNIVYDVSSLMYGEHILARKVIQKNIETEGYEYLLRYDIKEEIREAAFPDADEEKESNLAGDVTTNMEE